MSQPKKRPSWLWLAFYGRRRRGFPWLLAGVLALIVALALLFAIPGASDIARSVPAVLFGLLIVGAVVLALVAVFVPRRRD